MGREINEEEDFSEYIERLLAGQEVEVGEDVSEDYRTAIQFVQKLEGLREEPSSVFKDQLRRRLLLKLAEREAEEERQRKKKTSFRETLRNLIPRSPVWRTATATVAVAVLAAVVFWGSGIFTQAPDQWEEGGLAPTIVPSPKVAHEGPPVAVHDSGDILNLEPILEETNVYLPGEEVRIDLVFRNTSTESIIVTPFPPAIQISRADTGEVVRSMSPGSESTEISASGKLRYTLVWDQLNDHGKRVEPGRYSIIVSDATIQRGTGLQEAEADFGPVTEVIIQSPP